MLYTLIEDSLKNIEGHNRFKLVHAAVKLAKSAPVEINDRPVLWALKTIAKAKEKHTTDSSS